MMPSHYVGRRVALRKFPDHVVGVVEMVVAIDGIPVIVVQTVGAQFAELGCNIVLKGEAPIT